MIFLDIYELTKYVLASQFMQLPLWHLKGCSVILTAPLYGINQNILTKNRLFPKFQLRLLTGSFILVESAMFGANFNLVTGVGLP